MAPLRRGGLHRRHAVFSSLVGTAQTVTQRAEERAWQRLGRDGQEAATIAEAVEEVCSSPPAKLGDINEVLAITTVCLARWQADMLPTRIWQSYSLTDTVPTTDILGKIQEEQPSMTSGECVGITPCRALVKTVSRPEWTGTPLPVPIYLKRSEDGLCRCCSSGESLRCFPTNGAHTSLHHRADVEQTGVH